MGLSGQDRVRQGGQAPIDSGKRSRAAYRGEYPAAIGSDTVTAAEIAGSLHGYHSGLGFVARCPVHQDHTASLSIVERDGRVLVHCHAGCSQSDVIDALRSRNVWPQREYLPRTPAERAQRIESERMRRDALYFASTARILAEWVLVDLSPTDPERAVQTALLAALRVSPETEYRAWLKYHAALAGALVHAGRERERRLVHMILAYMTAEEAHAA